jgi:hypothetical protein
MKPSKQDMYSELMLRFQSLKKARLPYEAVWPDISKFCHQGRSSWDLQPNLVLPKIFNSRAADNLNRMANGFQGYMVSRVKGWFRHHARDLRKESEPGVADYLEESTRIQSADLASTNFYTEVSEFIKDGASIATAIMYAEPHPVTNQAILSCRHPKECWIADGPDGVVDTVYRHFRMANREAMKRWGNMLSASSIEKAKADPNGFMEIIHAVQPREDWNPDSIFSMDKRWGSYYIDVGAGEVIDEGGYDIFPYFVWRWAKNSDECYGTGPAYYAMADILRSQQVSRTQLDLAQKVSDPALMIPSTMQDSYRVNPGGRNFYSSTLEKERIEAVGVGANFPITAEIAQAINDSIDSHFMVDFFLTLASIDRQMTAREVMERKGEQSAVLSAVVGSFQTEFLQLFLAWHFDLLTKNGAMPEAPRALMEDGIISLEFTGYLANLQRSYLETSGIAGALEIIVPLSQQYPETVDNIDTDELIRQAADAYGLPQKILRERPDVLAIRKRKAEAAAAEMAKQEQLQQQATLIENSDKLGRPSSPDSPLGQIMRSMGGPPAVQQ